MTRPARPSKPSLSSTTAYRSAGVCAFSVAFVVTQRAVDRRPRCLPDPALTALWAQDRSSGLHGPALPDMDFRNRASSNFSSNIVSESGSTNFAEDLVRLQAEATGDDFLLDLGGAAEDRLNAAEPPELTIVAENSGSMFPPVHGRTPPGQRKPRRSCDVSWAAVTRHGIVSPCRNSRSAAWSRRRRRTSNRGYPSHRCGRRVRSAHRGTAAAGPRDAPCPPRRPDGVALLRATARQSGSRPG